jgi:GxxExxY protein
MDTKEKDPRTYAIIGVAMEVHKEMGPGFLEAVYHECLEIEFQIRNIPYISKPRLKLYYKSRQLEKYYEPDFLIYSEIVVEIKAAKSLTKNDEAQIINSLKGSKQKVGLLINFGELSLKFKRFIY